MSRDYDHQMEKDFLLDDGIQREDLHEKGSKRALQIRRALEDREETKRLSSLCGGDYWEDI
ncbi:hypothetical protein [Candidatus Sororendozoicomonas aggregata]|uniref:hypothetical protein n=1 Tax=Candidatus Sororendozoicomonas aggregata TaxID=3073239 RepID=UPI002ED4E73D